MPRGCGLSQREITAQLAQNIQSFNKRVNFIDITEAPYNADSTGLTDSTDAIILALNSVNKIKIPKGTFLIKPDLIKILNDGTQILADEGATLKCDSFGTLLIGVNANNVLIDKNLTLDGNNKVRIGLRVGVGFKNIRIYSSIRNIYSDNSLSVGAWISGETENIVLSCNIDNVKSEPNGVEGDNSGASRGVHVAPIGTEGVPNNVVIENCIIQNISTKEDADGISIQGWNNQNVNATIRNNHLNYCSKRALKIMVAGVKIYDNVLINPYTDMRYFISIFGSDTLFSRNQLIGGTASSAISIGTPLWAVENVKIENNLISPSSNDGTYGLITSTNQINGLQIVNNTIRNSDGSGIYIRERCTNAVISNNIIENVKAGITISDYDYVEIKNISIISNIIHAINDGINNRAGECFIVGNSGSAGWTFVLTSTIGKSKVQNNLSDVFAVLPTASKFYQGQIITVRGQYSNSPDITYICKNIGNDVYEWKELSFTA